jgi:hypothetical protein
MKRDSIETILLLLVDPKSQGSTFNTFYVNIPYRPGCRHNKTLAPPEYQTHFYVLRTHDDLA